MVIFNYFLVQIFFYFSSFFLPEDFLIYQKLMDFSFFTQHKLPLIIIIVTHINHDGDLDQKYSFLFFNLQVHPSVFIYFLSFYHLHFS